jgi:uncharacterized membrane protein YhaH (DUF805 family)
MDQPSPLEWALLPLKKYAVFNGRAPRAEYWWFYLATIIAGIPLAILDKVFGTENALSTVLNLVLLAPWLAGSVRRLHDTDRSGWWLLAFVGAFAVIGALVAVASIGAFGDSRPIGAGSFTSMIVGLVIFLGLGVTFLVFMVLPGTEGPNRYGPDPYGPSDLEEVFA